MKTGNSSMVSNWLHEAVKFQRDGNLDEAEELYEKVLRCEPGNADALHLQGLVDFSKGNIEDAIRKINMAIAVDPTFPDFFRSLGSVQKSAGQLEEALKNYQKTISMNPTDIVALYEAASISHQMGKLDIAETVYKKCIQIKPNHTGAINSLGLIYKSRSRFNVAASCFKRALAIDPGLSAARCNLAVTLKDQGKMTEALNELQRIVATDPDYPKAYYHMGLVLTEMGKAAQAINAYKKAISGKIDFGLAYNNCGILLQELGRTGEAVACFQKAVALDPTNAKAHYNLGVLHKYQGYASQAYNCMRMAIEIDPDFTMAKTMMQTCLKDICQWPIEIDKNNGNKDIRLELAAISRRLFNELSDDYPVQVLKSALKRSSNIQLQAEVLSSSLCDEPSRYEGKKVIVGYLSNNFRDHPTSHLIVDMFSQHDRTRFEINCFSYGEDDGSFYRKEIEKGCDHFVDLYNINSLEAASKIHQTKTQILIDLNGYTACSRTEICGFRPAPIQVRYLGEAKTAGASFFDYIVTDPIVTPLEHASHYSEKLVHMPHSYQVNSNPRVDQKINLERQSYRLPTHGFIFCSFATGYKIDPELFACWMTILKQTPDSILWLIKRDEKAESNLKSVASMLGIDPKRLIFSPPCHKPEHLARLSLADLCLDTRAVNGAATTSDALWAGVPVVTIKGRHFASRMSASILTAVGLEELITDDLQQYAKLAAALATDGKRLKTLREKLERNKRTQPLFDTRRFVRNLENAYEQMWAIYKSGGDPRHIQVKDCGPSADMHGL
ncbi:tetratricopeptide repeat protein [uncultured Desulfosarcina sp.]|uniref:tetratricopeptide repeat protein n=1 Tax=uncultured Desulfosarcina sp. TaxID=218289 RepID=UPI0029C7A7A7|nr:tetratricopeptide repeat protein [uncultured Desulfosarcina sp.]